MTTVSLEEQETIINFSRTDTGAEIFTTDRTMMTKLDKLCEESPEFWKCKRVDHFLDGSLANKVYTVADKSLVSFRSKKIKRELTDEQKAEIAERFRRTKFSEQSDTQLATEFSDDVLE